MVWILPNWPVANVMKTFGVAQGSVLQLFLIFSRMRGRELKIIDQIDN